MYRFFYTTLLYLSVPLILCRLLYRSLQAPAYRLRWRERFGVFVFPQLGAEQLQPLWIHAVSVGETLAAEPLVRRLLIEHPKRPLIITTMTPTGSERVRSLFGDRVFHVYAPYDLPGAVKRFLRQVNPAALIIMETEIWPNTAHLCWRCKIPLLLVNGRMSAKSLSGYQRIATITREALTSFTTIAAQSDTDAQRYVTLGATAERVQVTGSLKFDVTLPQLDCQELPLVLRSLENSHRPILIAASTREGEDEKVIAAFQSCLQQQPQLMLILVPRHPERFDSVAQMVSSQGLSLVRRSDNREINAGTQVVLGDSMGEMWLYFSIADVAFVGGSLVDTGCHNVLEPTALGLPVLVGPSQFNFESICQMLQQAGSLITVADEKDLAQQVLNLLVNKEKRLSMSAAGKTVVENNRGALDKILQLIDQSLH